MSRESWQTILREFWLFTLKQASACIFGFYLLFLIIGTKYIYPEDVFLSRNDFLFFAAILFQAFLLICKLESFKEALVIIIFHILATGMELFKTSNAIGAWSYPGEFIIGIGNVPLFAGFMYSAVGSYIARIWRIFKFRFSSYPPIWLTIILVILIYANFFTHHFAYDIRWILMLVTVMLFGRCLIYFQVDREYRYMPFILGLLLVALFIWFAENIATFAGIWLYPSQVDGWEIVSLSKLLAWFLLMLLSFVLVSLVHKAKLIKAKS